MSPALGAARRTSHAFIRRPSTTNGADCDGIARPCCAYHHHSVTERWPVCRHRAPSLGTPGKTGHQFELDVLNRIMPGPVEIRSSHRSSMASSASNAIDTGSAGFTHHCRASPRRPLAWRATFRPISRLSVADGVAALRPLTTNADSANPGASGRGNSSSAGPQQVAPSLGTTRSGVSPRWMFAGRLRR